MRPIGDAAAFGGVARPENTWMPNQMPSTIQAGSAKMRKKMTMMISTSTRARGNSSR
jgi:hypothetical protein